MVTKRSGSARTAEQGEQRAVVVLTAPFPGHPPNGRASAPRFDRRRGSFAGEGAKQRSEETAMRDEELRQKNAFLREKIKEISDRHPELRAGTEHACGGW